MSENWWTSLYAKCTPECERSAVCADCGLRKAPRGRSVPVEAANGYCDRECPGHDRDPLPGHLWPGELAQLQEQAQEEGIL